MKNILLCIGAAFLTGCATVSLEEPSSTLPQNTETTTVQTVATPPEYPVKTVAPKVETPVLVNNPKIETFACKVTWKDDKKSRETGVFKLKIDYVKKTVDSGSFSAKASNVSIEATTIRFTAYNKSVAQIGTFNREKNTIITEFVNSKTKARIDGQGSCSKVTTK